MGKIFNLSQALITKELEESELRLLARSQKRSFPDELQKFHSGDRLKALSSLLPLNPKLGSGGLLTVGGRLNHSSLSHSKRHTKFLHRSDILTRIIVSFEHLSLLHAGCTLILSVVGRSFHIIGARRLIRTVCRRCITCKKVAARTETQIMGQLLIHRVTPSPTSTKSGIYFSRPLLIRKGHTRKPVYIKSYVCILVCFATKAVHLELVSDLTTEAFIACFRRFISRRGLPTDVFSDNGSNFVRASNELSELYSFLSQSQYFISKFFSNIQVTWHFSPERSPHFGGNMGGSCKIDEVSPEKSCGHAEIDI